MEIPGNIVTLVTIVASVLVLLYSLWYCVILFFQKKQGTIRQDWNISLLFYIGIILITIGQLLTTLRISENAGGLTYLAALILFVCGFEKRAGLSTRLASKLSLKEPLVKKIKKK